MQQEEKHKKKEKFKKKDLTKWKARNSSESGVIKVVEMTAPKNWPEIIDNWYALTASFHLSIVWDWL